MADNNVLGSNNGYGFDSNQNWLNLGLQGLSSIGEFFSSRAMLNEAKRQNAFKNKMALNQYNSQVQNYNTALEDKYRDAARFSGLNYSGSSWEDRYNSNKLDEA